MMQVQGPFTLTSALASLYLSKKQEKNSVGMLAACFISHYACNAISKTKKVQFLLTPGTADQEYRNEKTFLHLRSSPDLLLVTPPRTSVSLYFISFCLSSSDQSI